MSEKKFILKGDRGTGGLTVLCKECYIPIEYIKRGENRNPKSAYCEKHSELNNIDLPNRPVEQVV